MKTIPISIFLSITALLLLSSCDPASPPVAADPYPLEVCVVSGEKLGSMGEPHVVTQDGVTVKFCCEHCLPEFEKDPAKFVAMVTSASKP